MDGFRAFEFFKTDQHLQAISIFLIASHRWRSSIFWHGSIKLSKNCQIFLPVLILLLVRTKSILQRSWNSFVISFLFKKTWNLQNLQGKMYGNYFGLGWDEETFSVWIYRWKLQKSSNPEPSKFRVFLSNCFEVPSCSDWLAQ